MTSPNSTDRQNERLLERLRKGPVTSCELIRDLDIIRPSARIYDLRQEGHQIVTAWDWDRVNGTEHRVGRYVLLPKEPDQKHESPGSATNTTEARYSKASKTKFITRMGEMVSFAALAFIVTWALGSAVLGMAESSTPDVGVMLAGMVTDGR